MNYLYMFIAIASSSLVALPSKAQVVSDGSFFTNASTPDGLNFIITGGNRAGSNLFHSFEKFSIPRGGAATFDVAPSVRNTFARVTGLDVSRIDGKITILGSSSNLFLINPNGIIFGQNAQLDIGGSFLATTAERLEFADGTTFSTQDTSQPPLLTISAPIGLGFGTRSGRIVNRSQQGLAGGIPVGLEVRDGQTLGLIGIGVSLESGTLTARAGNIQVGSVAPGSFVTLAPAATAFEFGYDNVRAFGDIDLTGESRANTSLDVTSITDFSNLPSGGAIHLQGRNIEILGSSEVLAFNDGTETGGGITVSASGLLLLAESNIDSTTFSSGDAGDILIQAESLRVSNDSFISATTQLDRGQGGTIIVKASAIEIDDSQVTAQSFSPGNGGIIDVNAERLLLTNGGRLINSAFSSGDGGDIIVRGSDAEIVGTNNRGSASGILSKSFESATGSGGTIEIEVSRLVIAAGNISVEAEGTGAAGNITIAADVLRVESGGSLNASTRSPESQQGNIALDVGDILLIRDGAIATDSPDAPGSGDIDLTLGDLSLAIGLENVEATGGVVAIARNTTQQFTGEVIDVELPTPEDDIALACADPGRGSFYHRKPSPSPRLPGAAAYLPFSEQEPQHEPQQEPQHEQGGTAGLPCRDERVFLYWDVDEETGETTIKFAH